MRYLVWAGSKQSCIELELESGYNHNFILEKIHSYILEFYFGNITQVSLRHCLGYEHTWIEISGKKSSSTNIIQTKPLCTRKLNRMDEFKNKLFLINHKYQNGSDKKLLTDTKWRSSANLR